MQLASVIPHGLSGCNQYVIDLGGIVGLFAVVLGHATAPVSRADINGAIARVCSAAGLAFGNSGLVASR
jgi:hypothetical protein